MIPPAPLWHNRYLLEKKVMASKGNRMVKTEHANPFGHSYYRGFLDLARLLE